MVGAQHSRVNKFINSCLLSTTTTTTTGKTASLWHIFDGCQFIHFRMKTILLSPIHPHTLPYSFIQPRVRRQMDCLRETKSIWTIIFVWLAGNPFNPTTYNFDYCAGQGHQTGNLLGPTSVPGAPDYLVIVS